MNFGELPLAEAAGAILAHGARAQGRVLKKGHVLSPDDIEMLRQAGFETVTAARLGADDIGEDEAAKKVARALAGPGVRLGKPFTGRCNLFADWHGVAAIDRERLARINLVDEAVTVATVTPYDVALPGQMLATVKIIPFAVPGAVLDSCIEAAGGGEPLVNAPASGEPLVNAPASGEPLVSVRPFQNKKAGLILTQLPGLKEKLLASAQATVGARLEQFGSRIASEIRCAHDRAEVAAAITAQLRDGLDPILILGASATVDRRDTVPAAVVDAGGRIEHFGMPVDPGNLLFLAAHGDTTIIGMPSCARSPKINGFDWILWRVLADVAISPEDIMAMGAGGLLKEMAGRPQPRLGAQEIGQATGRPRIAALILAAGASRRMGNVNKLLAEVGGRPMVVRVVEAVSASGAAPVVVVTGHEGDAVAAVLAGGNVNIVHNPDYSKGMSTSLRAGLGALPADIDGVIICLGDMPLVRAADIDRLIAAFDPVEGRAICVPAHGRKRGNPVLWGSNFFTEMAELSGDIGARHLLEEHAREVFEVAIEDDGVVTDIDTPERLAQITGNMKSSN